MLTEKKLLFEEIDKKIEVLLKYRDEEFIIEKTELRASICAIIEKCYFLQFTILMNRRFKENNDIYFFSAQHSANRHYRDWGLDEIADIYNDLRKIALIYMD